METPYVVYPFTHWWTFELLHFLFLLLGELTNFCKVAASFSLSVMKEDAHFSTSSPRLGIVCVFHYVPPRELEWIYVSLVTMTLIIFSCAY